jgi:DNA-binding transcriptional MerR regulator
MMSPRYTDPGSAYRYYHVDQLHRARLIRAMRDGDAAVTMAGVAAHQRKPKRWRMSTSDTRKAIRAILKAAS